MSCCLLPPEYIPFQYRCRASEARKILSVNNSSVEQVASRIVTAEIIQIVFFSLQTTLYALAYTGAIPSLYTGVVSLFLVPIEAYAAYNTFPHFKPCARALMTAAAIFMLSVCAGFACMGIVTDSAITLCASGIFLHIARNISDGVDAHNASKNPHYVEHVLNFEKLQ